jgi:TonB family protein
MTAIARALSTALLDFVWQGLLVAFLLWTALSVLQNRSARARYLASCAALALMAALPVVTACLVYTAPDASRETVGWIAAAPQPLRTAMPVPSGSSFGWLARWALPIWTLGVLAFSLRLVWATRQISALRREAKPAEDAVAAVVAGIQQRMRLARPVRVLISEAGECPSVVGWIKPALLLPGATILGLTPQQLEAVLAHELAHILRYDYLVNMLQTVVETLLFYHPAVWWASTRIRQERELCCDDLAVESCGDALCYARALTRLERLRVAAPRLALGSAGGSLLYRIQRLAGDAGWQRGPSKLPGVLALSLGLICFALNMQWARGQQPEASAPSPAAVESVESDEPGVRVDLGGASVIHRDEVEYPEAAIEKGIQGTVVVEATLDADGAVGDARVLSGPPELRKAALESVLQWHFTRVAAGSTRQIGIVFQLGAPRDAAQNAASPRSRADVRALAQVQREQARVQAQVRKQMAESMAEQALIVQDPPSYANRLQAEAKMLADMLQKPEAEQVSDEVAKLYAEVVRDNEPPRNELAGSQPVEALREQEIAALQQRLAELQAGMGSFRGASMFAGRRLRSIRIQGLADASREELLAKLPAHVGDTLAEDSLEKVETAVKQFDADLQFSMRTTRDGQVEIRIGPRGSGDGAEPRQ